MNKPFSLSKLERLKSKKDIDTLFLSGKAFFVFPFKVFFNVKNADDPKFPTKFGISVPKKNFKHAVDRNRLKRVTREIFRVNKIELNENLIAHHQCMHIMMVYSHKEKMSYEELRPVVATVVKRLMKQGKESGERGA